MNVDSVLFIGGGLLLTLALLFTSLCVGLVLGGVLALGVLCPKTRFVTRSWISLVRGTPALLQLSFIYFLLPRWTGVSLGVFGAGVVALGINSAAYIAEIYRGGIESVSLGQMDASKTLGINVFYRWRDIMAPQAFRTALPGLMNEVIALGKETSLVSTIGGLDIMRRAQMVGAQDFSYFGPLVVAAVYYYLLTLLWEWMGRWMENRIKW